MPIHVMLDTGGVRTAMTHDEPLRGASGTCITAPGNSLAQHSSSRAVSTIQALCWSFQTGFHTAQAGWLDCWCDTDSQVTTRIQKRRGWIHITRTLQKKLHVELLL